MTNQETIKDFTDNFEATLDGFESSDDVASGFFNAPCSIDEYGDIWIENQGLVSESRLGDFVTWIKENGHC